MRVPTIRVRGVASVEFRKKIKGPKKPIDRRRKRPTEGLESEPVHPLARANTVFWRRFDLQDGTCYLCSEPFTDDDWATQDHVIPKGKGGRYRGNILLAHAPCNFVKGDRWPTPDELAYLACANTLLAPAPTRVHDTNIERGSCDAGEQDRGPEGCDPETLLHP